jgi:hypothetical protein
MTGPELDRDLEAIGRRLSPRLGHAHDTVVGRATRGAAARRPRPALPRLSRLGGAAFTLAFSAGFAALLAVGVASRPGPSDPHGSAVARVPSVAMATSPSVPVVTGAPGGGPATPPPGGMIAPAPDVATVSPTPAGGVTTGPTTPASGPTTLAAPTGPAPQQTAPATAEPSGASAPTHSPAPAQSPPPQHSAPVRVTSSPTAAPAPGKTVKLTEADSGRTISVPAGTRIEVRLSASGPMAWTGPSSSDETVVTRTGGSPDAKGGASGSFNAARGGNADLTATENPNCRPQCMMPSRLWLVHIVVTG